MSNLPTDEQIKELALANGFRLKEQPDGTQDLNPYVYSTIRDAVAKFGGATGYPWISVDDALPSDGQDVIVWRYNKAKGANIEYSIYSDDPMLIGFGNVKDEQGMLRDVYYWMPAPLKRIQIEMAARLGLNEAEVNDD